MDTVPEARARGQAVALRLGPPQFPTIIEILSHSRAIALVLTRCGVQDRDVPDLAQEVVVAAWQRVQAGEYRPERVNHRRASLSRWITRIAYHHATHWLDLAEVRRAEPTEDPWARAGDPGLDPVPSLEARDTLRILSRLPAVTIETILAMGATGGSVEDYASERDLPISTAYKRISRAKREAMLLLRDPRR